MEPRLGLIVAAALFQASNRVSNVSVSSRGWDGLCICGGWFLLLLSWLFLML